MTNNLKSYIIEKWPERFKKSGLNQKQFAAYSKVSRPALSEILSGKRKSIHQSTIDRVEKTFKDLGV
jgi:transcriptional regulator with XRE-family HTH domain